VYSANRSSSETCDAEHPHGRGEVLVKSATGDWTRKKWDAHDSKHTGELPEDNVSVVGIFDGELSFP
jgi:hypothetical protein